MDFSNIIERFETAIIQIATMTGTGTGFYVKQYNLIVTNDHVVDKSAEVSIAGKLFDKRLARVWFTDRKHDLAFIEPPAGVDLPEVKLGKYEGVKPGDEVVALGHPFDLIYTATQGVISKVDRIRSGLKYIQVDAAINPGNSGGPLVYENGEVLGVNSFIIRGGDNLGFALPVSYLKTALDLYAPYYGQASTRCPSCETLVLPSNIEADKYCPSCGTEVKLPQLPEKEPEPVGVGKLIEDILKSLGKDVKLARNGLNRWEVREGTARIKIHYNQDNYFIAGDAYLCTLPNESSRIVPLYTFLLHENYRMNGLVLSTVNQNIILSRIIYDLDINKETGSPLFRDLFRKAAEYDHVLKTSYGCQDLLQE
jgi:serine protease Do